MSDKFINVADLKDPSDVQRRTYREINNATEHSFSVGQLVELSNGVRMFVAKQTRDCDGTPLYSLTADDDEETAQINPYSWVHGYSEDGMAVYLAPSDAEATIAAAQKLPDKWRLAPKQHTVIDGVTVEIPNKHTCADDLDAVVGDKL
ncbi:MAG: hypothetical protein KOO63_08275 [Bacteroidales bacterium]|nr:hypothetical protein [Candidatus Latescibacterota bacterium]